MNLQYLDERALELGFFPIGISLGLLLISASIFWPQIWNHIRRYSQNKERFEKEFGDQVHQQARQDFWWTLQALYKKRTNEAEDRLAIAIRDTRFPKGFPPNDLYNWQQTAEWDNQISKRIWEFYDSIFSEGFSKDGTGPLFDEQFIMLTRGRRIAAKFWDDWARKLIYGKVRYKDIKRPLDANKWDIKALAISEIALARYTGLDEGPGKEALFWLAFNLDNLNDYSWIKRAKKSLESK